MDPSARCFAVLPPETGADPAGANATAAHYVLEPVSGGDGKLVLFLNGSGGSPAGAIGDVQKNVYTAGIAEGHQVIALSYRSGDAVGALCVGADACFLPTRTTLVTGSYQAGAAKQVKDILPSEGIHARLELLLQYLVAADPAGAWGTFLGAGGKGIAWDHVIVSGHSQGGGHAALLGKLHPVARVVAFSSPCDAVNGTPASWLHGDNTWASLPVDKMMGFSALTEFNDAGTAISGDTTCTAHAAVWNDLGLSAANKHDDAILCAQSTGHGATIGCAENFPMLRALYRLP